MENLREQVMINQFAAFTACDKEQAKQFLHASDWQFEVDHRHMIVNHSSQCHILFCLGLGRLT